MASAQSCGGVGSLGDTVLARRAWGQDPTPMGLEGSTLSERIILSLRAHDVCLAKFCTCLGPVILSFPSSPSWNGNAYPMSVPPEYLGST